MSCFKKISLTVALLVGVSCKTKAPVAESSKNKSFIAELSNLAKWSVESVGNKRQVVIPVCLVHDNNVPEKIYHAFQDALISEFSRASVLLTEWHYCQADDYRRPNMKLRLINPTYRTLVKGASYVGKPLGTHLHNGSTTWFEVRDSVRFGKIDNAELSTAIHEIGHAVGLLHEANRDDSTCNRKTSRIRGRKIGEYDPNSVMNYCRNRSTATSLTLGDIAGIKALYNLGSPPQTIPAATQNPRRIATAKPKPAAVVSPVQPKIFTGNWVKTGNGNITGSPIAAGQEGRALYVCRIEVNGRHYTGKLIAGDQCRVGISGREVKSAEYEVLQNLNHRYTMMADGAIPDRALATVVLGGDKYEYACRVKHLDTVQPGRLVEGEDSCRIGYGGKEYLYVSYEILSL